MKNIVCFGEVLWDVLPTKKIGGGAPMNVSIRLQSLEVSSKMISKIGADALGKELLEIIKSKNVTCDLIQIDEKLNTGEVIVTLDDSGSASYEIIYPSAWDKIALTKENLTAVSKADALVYGSLSCRDQVSKNTLFELLKVSKYNIFDVNLRKPFYSTEFINEMMLLADFIKFNDDELLHIAQELGSKYLTIEDNILFISKLTNTNSICVTKGKDGAILYYENQFFNQKGFDVKVADTIGSGDSFLAGFLSKFLYTKNPQQALKFGCAIGAMVATFSGANPVLSKDDIEVFISSTICLDQ